MAGASNVLKVSRSTIDDRLKLREKTGKIEATINYHRGPAAALSDSLELRSFIEEDKNSTLSRIAEAWFAARGRRLSTVTFSKTLKRLGYTRKKELSLQRAFTRGTASVRAGAEHPKP